MLEGPVGQFQVQRAGGALIGSGCLGSRADAAAAEQVGQAWVVLPVAQDSHQPGRSGKEGVGLQARPPQQQVVAAAGALAAPALLTPTAQAHGRGGLLQQQDPVGIVLPAGAYRQVHLQHAGVGRQAQHLPVAAAVHRQHAAELRPLPGAAVPGDQLQQLFQGLPG